ncbi:MAG: hypothetical protein RDV48_00505 [Candidatus Eremiobacteraeota bacterium]|nr:hypothetical protein [Candidatus Eremiobacteraeota bacterium]
MRKTIVFLLLAASFISGSLMPAHAQAVTFSSDSSPGGAMTEFASRGPSLFLQLNSVGPGINRLRILNAANNDVMWDNVPTPGASIYLPPAHYRAYCWSGEASASGASVAAAFVPGAAQQYSAPSPPPYPQDQDETVPGYSEEFKNSPADSGTSWDSPLNYDNYRANQPYYNMYPASYYPLPQGASNSSKFCHYCGGYHPVKSCTYTGQ